MTEDLQRFALGLPKAELHVHLEGTLEPELMFALAKRNGVELPYASVEELRAAYDFTDLQAFLDLYYAGCSVLVTEEDFYDLTWEYLVTAARENISHVEPSFDPQAHTMRGIHFGTAIAGILRALEDGEQRFGITFRLILSILRDRPVAEAVQTLEHARMYRRHITAIGLDSAEVGHPPDDFAGVFALAREQGWHAVAHAGEEGPPEYITGALDALGAERIDHGNRCLEDAALTARLVRDRVPLTVCPLSNIELRVVDDIGQHPLKRMLDAGLFVTVNSDDPAYFGGYLTANYVAAARALGLDRDDLAMLAEASYWGSFLDPDSKARHIEAVRSYLRAESAV